MIQWQNLTEINAIPKNGIRVLVGRYGKTSGYTPGLEEHAYFPWSFFEIDIIQFNWEQPERNEYVIWSKNHEIVTAEFILSKYNKYCIIYNEVIPMVKKTNTCLNP